jgi:hypothetical protein
MKEWIEPQDIPVPHDLQAAIGGHPLVAATLARRGLTEVEAARAFLEPDRYRPAPPTDLPNIVGAAERLERAIRQEETICVWGDFDVDGQTSTTILVSTLRDLGATVRYHIPHRQRESHGVNLLVLQQLITDGVELLPDIHPLRELPGVGVAYELAELLYRRAGRPQDATQYLDLAALGVGETVEATTLSPGWHTITLTATDDDAVTGTALVG